MALLLPVVAVSLVYAGNVVSNGDFSLDTSYWMPVVANLWTGAPCDDGASSPALAVMPTGFSGSAYQCINITSGGSEWTLSADMRLENASVAQVMAQFYTQDSCNGGVDHAESIQQSPAISPTWETLSTTFTYSALTGSSVAVSLSSQAGTACFDNVSLAAPGATDVTLHSPEAPGPARPLWALPVLGLGLVAIAVTLLWRRRSARQ